MAEELGHERGNPSASLSPLMPMTSAEWLVFRHART
jgi:hypothetical protein